MENFSVTIDLDAGVEVQRGQVIYEDTGVFKVTTGSTDGGTTQVLVANTDGEAGTPLGGVIQGPQHVLVGGTVDKFDLLMPGAGGRAVKLVEAPGNVVIGKALEAGSDGDLVYAFLDLVAPRVVGSDD